MARTRSRFVAGVTAAFRGLKVATHNEEVRKTYAQLAIAIFVVALALDAAGIWTIIHFTSTEGVGSWWLSAGLFVLRIAGIAIVLLAAPIIAMFIVNTLFPFLAEKVFFAGMRTVSPVRAAELEALKGLSLPSSIAQNLVRLILYIALSLFSFAISFIPVAGAILGPFLQGYFTARALGWELLDPYFEKLGMKFDEQYEFVKANRSPLVGYALPYSFVMAIPIFGPLIYGLAQAGAGVMVAQLIEATPDGKPPA